MKIFYKSNLLFLLFLTNCQSVDTISERPNIPDVLELRESYIPITNDTFKFENIRDKVQSCNVPIYFYVGDNSMVRGSAIATGKIPDKFDVLTRNILSQMGARVILAKAKAERYNMDKKKKRSLYEIEGEITAYAKNQVKTGSKPGINLQFGSGHGESEAQSKWENIYQLSRLTLTTNIEHNGMLFLPIKAKTDLEIINQVNNYSISVYGNGIGIKNRSFMKDSTEEAVEQMLRFSLIQAMEAILTKHNCNSSTQGSWEETSVSSNNKDTLSEREDRLKF
ncbi:MAG TPA: hypothetical protein EYG73_00365 [Arcobacter sp.]|nr:hypothetical protein [Arcobacter sp.]